MSNIIKHIYSEAFTIPITLSGLGSSSDLLSGRQSDMISNVSGFTDLQIHFSVRAGSSPSLSRNLTFHALKGEKSPSTTRTDGVGTGNSPATILTAEQLGNIQTTTGVNQSYSGSFLFSNPGPEWGIFVAHNMGTNLSTTGTDHFLKYIGITPQII